MGGKYGKYLAWWMDGFRLSVGVTALIVLCNVAGCGFRPRDTLSDLSQCDLSSILRS